MTNQRFAHLHAIPAENPRLQRKPSKRHNPFIFMVLSAALLVSLTQVGCTGLTSANATDPTNATTIAVAGATGSFGSVATGSSLTKTFTVTNTGSATLTITQLAASGSGFSLSGFTLPINVTPGQGTSFVAKFAPTTAGAVTGSISMTANTNPAVTTVTLSGTGTSSGQPSILIQPTAVSFGGVGLGQNVGQAMSITNTGSGVLTISNISVAGAGFSVSGFSGPITLVAGQATTVIADINTSTAGSISGSITFSNNSSTPSMVIPLSGTGMSSQGQPVISVNPTSVSFGNVTVGAPNSQTILIQNTGTSVLTISQATASGAGFSLSGLSVPATIAAGSSTTFNVAFAPANAGAVSGSVSLVNNAAGSPLAIPLSATGVASTFLLGASASSLTFPSVGIGSNSSQNVTLTNSGNSTVTIGSVSATGAGFTASGVAAGQMIGAGQTATLSVTFSPASATTAPGTVTVTSNATNSPINISLSGTGTQATAHSVSLSWTASTSTVVGYNVYRSTISGGPYTLITSSPVPGETYTDTSVQAGVTYFYVVTAVDSNGNESAFSNEAPVTVPTP
jgi:Abnormal spindle-like microcephaly-assoc'd, ASPM-SPD-2-Hydin/Protein of unknown function (DUF1573)